MKKKGGLNQRVGRNVRAHRQRLGLSQQEFAHRLSFDRTYVGGVERGERNITLDTLEALARMLDIDPLDLLRPASDPTD